MWVAHRREASCSISLSAHCQSGMALAEAFGRDRPKEVRRCMKPIGATGSLWLWHNRFVATYLEMWSRTGVKLVPLERLPIAIGKRPGVDAVIEDDRTVSRLHAVVEPVGGGWCVRDLGSRNGTFVNGQRIWAEQALHRGDEIRVGSTRIVFRDEDSSVAVSQTVVAKGAPELTRRERDVLVALCRPLLAGGVFREPASVREMAGELVVSEAAVKQHLSHLYDKFGLYDLTERRRVRLANEAVARGAVSVTDVRGEQ